jgi:hypothetical protein
MKVAVCENGTGGECRERLREAITENGWESWVELTAISQIGDSPAGITSLFGSGWNPPSVLNIFCSSMQTPWFGPAPFQP